jgi:hypothetical protein
MSKYFGRKRVVGVIGAIAVLAIAGAAYAYFSTTGSGTGTATVGTSSVLTIHGSTSGALYPGTTSAVTFTVDNPSAGHQQLGTIHLASVGACSVAWTYPGGTPTCTGTTISTCQSSETGASDTNTANWWMPDVAENQDLPTGNGQTVTTPGALKLNDLASAQDSCKNAFLNLNFTS